MTATRIRRLTLTDFRSYTRREIEIAARSVVLVGSQRRRQDQPDRGDFAAGARARLAPRDTRRGGLLGRRRFMGGLGRCRGHSRPGVARDRHRSPGGQGNSRFAQVPHRSRAGFHRPPRSPTTCRSSGSFRQWTPCSIDQVRTTPFPRSPGACRRQRACRPGRGHGALAPLSHNRLLEDRAPIRIGLMPSSYKTAELSVARGGAARAETVGRLRVALVRRREAGSFFPAAEIALDGWMEIQRNSTPAVEVEDRYRAVAQGKSAARRRRRPHPRRPAPLTDLTVIRPGKRVAAADASTGEEKALLIEQLSYLAHARASSRRCRASRPSCCSTRSSRISTRRAGLSL